MTNDYKHEVFKDIFSIYSRLIDQLYQTGARNFLFLNVPPIERAPYVRGTEYLNHSAAVSTGTPASRTWPPTLRSCMMTPLFFISIPTPSSTKSLMIQNRSSRLLVIRIRLIVARSTTKSKRPRHLTRNAVFRTKSTFGMMHCINIPHPGSHRCTSR